MHRILINTVRFAAPAVLLALLAGCVVVPEDGPYYRGGYYAPAPVYVAPAYHGGYRGGGGHWGRR